MFGDRTLEVTVEVDKIVHQMLNGELPVALEETADDPRPREVILSDAEEPITIYNN